MQGGDDVAHGRGGEIGGGQMPLTTMHNARFLRSTPMYKWEVSIGFAVGDVVPGPHGVSAVSKGRYVTLADIKRDTASHITLSKRI